MHKQDLDGLDWAFIRREELRTAQGETTFDIYLGKVLLNGQELEIQCLQGEEITEILLGSQWLMTLPLVVNFREGLLTLGE
jgi:predicted aspartyl protease